MRKRDWQNVSLDSVGSNAAFDPKIVVADSKSIDQVNSQLELLRKLEELIGCELAERQWTALTAELSGVPLPQIAEKFGTNTSSVYKLLHDAWKWWRRGLEAAGCTVDDVRAARA